jgi:4-amino-4-deoxy-L-arabinose transferase-like glycosyltransferase
MRQPINMDDSTCGLLRFRPRLSRLFSLGWVVGIILIYLIRYNGWLIPQLIISEWEPLRPVLGFGPYFADFAIGTVRDALLISGLVVMAFGVGAVVTKRWLPDNDLCSALCALATGFWVIAVAVLTLGTISVRLVPVVWIGLVSWLWPASRKFLHRGRDSQPRLDGWSWWLVAAVAGFALLSLPGTIVPSVEFDELEYHLGALAEYARAGRIVFLPHNFYSNFPQLTEMLYLPLLLGGSDVAAKLLHWSFGVLAAVSVYAVAAQLWTRRVAVTAAALFYCTPLIMELGEAARIDLATTYFSVLSFGMALLWCKQGGQPGGYRFWWAGWLAGLAVATKWTAVSVVAWPVLGLLIVVTLRSASGTGIQRWTILVGVCGLVLLGPLPWMAKNWFFAHNPVYPLLSGLFSSPYWNRAQAELFAARHYAPQGVSHLVQWAQLVWQYSMAERGTLPLLLATAPLILLARRVDRSVIRAGWVFVGAFAAWYFFTYRPWRFLLPVFPLLAFIGAYAVEQVLQSRIERVVARIGLTILLAISLAYAVAIALIDTEYIGRARSELTSLQYCLGQISRDEFVSRWGGGMFEAIIWMNRNLPPTAKVLYVAEARMFIARHAVVWSSPHDQHLLAKLSQSATDPRRLLFELRQQGITHIYMNDRELKRHPPIFIYMDQINWNLVNELLERHAHVVHSEPKGTVYELNDQ